MRFSPLALAAVACLGTAPAHAAVFLQFGQADATNVFSYTNDGSGGAALAASGSVLLPALSSLDLADYGLSTTDTYHLSLNATSTSGVLTGFPGQIGQYFSGSLSISSQSAVNVLTIDFADAFFGAQVGGNVASLSLSAPPGLMTMFSTVFDFANVETESFALSFNNAVLAAGGSPFGASAIGDSTMSGVGNFDSQPLPPPFVPTVPEPATWAMMALGIGLVGFATRRHRRLAVTS